MFTSTAGTGPGGCTFRVLPPITHRRAAKQQVAKRREEITRGDRKQLPALEQTQPCRQFH